MPVVEEVDARPRRRASRQRALVVDPALARRGERRAAPRAAARRAPGSARSGGTSTCAVASASGSARWHGAVGTPKKFASEARPTLRSRPSSSRRASAAVQSGGSDSRRPYSASRCCSRKRWSKRALCATSSASPAKREELPHDGRGRRRARAAPAARRPVSRATGSGSAIPGFTSDWKESTSSSPRTRTAPSSQMRSRVGERPVVSRSKTTSSASSSDGSARPPASATLPPMQATRLSPAVSSSSSERREALRRSTAWRRATGPPRPPSAGRVPRACRPGGRASRAQVAPLR